MTCPKSKWILRDHSSHASVSINHAKKKY